MEKNGISSDQDLVRELFASPFVVNIEKPFKSPDNVIKYLARYTQKVAISDSRIVSFDKVSGMVTFSYKDNRDGGKHKVMTLHGLEFMRRFFLHVLSRRLTKIRHYGFLANRCKQKNIDRCFRLLGKERKRNPLSASPDFQAGSLTYFPMVIGRCRTICLSKLPV